MPFGHLHPMKLNPALVMVGWGNGLEVPGVVTDMLGGGQPAVWLLPSNWMVTTLGVHTAVTVKVPLCIQFQYRLKPGWNTSPYWVLHPAKVWPALCIVE